MESSAEIRAKRCADSKNLAISLRMAIQVTKCLSVCGLIKAPFLGLDLGLFKANIAEIYWCFGRFLPKTLEVLGF